MRETDRNAKIGTLLECVRCDRLEFPKGLSCHKTTPEFDENTLPKGLRKAHATKTGAWGIIRVLTGSLIYTIEYPLEKRFILTKNQQGIIVPRMPHSVAPEGKVVFYIEFYSRLETNRDHETKQFLNSQR